MKKHLLLFAVALGSAVYCRAQWVAIPDSNFVAVLTQQYPGCMIDNFMDTNCHAITSATALACSHAGITDLNGLQYFDNLRDLDADDNNLTLPSPSLFPQSPFPDSLKYLNLSYNLNISLANVDLPQGLKHLRCMFEPYTPNNATFPLNLPPSLTDLEIYGMNNLAIASFPSSLIFLDCHYVNFQSFPSSLPQGLQTLNIYGSNLTSLPPLPASLGWLQFGYNISYADSLPALPPNLGNLLWGSNNGTGFFSPLPNTIRVLSCFDNNLTTLPILPPNLEILDCSYNNLVTLPGLPPTLRELRCNAIQADSLPTLPAHLNQLFCYNNHIGALPALPDGLIFLDCHSNLLTSVPELPASVRYFMCNDNNLTGLPELPDSLTKLDCRGNPNLHCLPQLKYINELYIDTINFQCIPNYGHIVNDYYRLLRKPLCDLFNNNGCPRYWNITGEVYKDENNNCSRQATETRASNTKLMLYRNGNLEQQTYTFNNGLYSFDTDTGTYTVKLDTTGLPFVITCPVNGIDTARVIPTDSMLYNNNFALQCKPGFDLGINSLVPRTPFRPAFYTSVKLNAGDLAAYYNLTCNTGGLGGSLTITLNGPVSFAAPAAGALTPSSIAGNVITYNIADWSAVNPATAFNFVAQTDTFAQLTQQVCVDVAIQPQAGDNVVQNNTFSACYPILTSFDPNEKEVQPKGIINNTPQWLTYTIRFQNTGTAPAQHIFIEDTISSKLDLTTFQLLNYSHEPLTQLYNTNNRLRFNFPNIELPDSLHNEADSHGYVQFRIKTKPGLNCGDSIADPAYIYFDYNAPVVTNAPVTNIKYYEQATRQYNSCSAQTYSFYGQLLSLSGTYRDTIQTPQICDSIITLQLSLGAATTAELTQSFCNGQQYNFYGTNLSTAGDYQHTLTNSAGCDSVVTLHLAMLQPTSAEVTDTFCSGQQYDFYGAALIAAGDYQHTLTNSAGCDSVVTLHLAVTQPTTTDVNQSICNGQQYNFYGTAITAAGDYQHTLSNSTGCDSVVTLHLAVTQLTTADINQSICNGQQFDFYGTSLTTAGNYQYTLTNSAGCDSVVTLHLAVTQPTTADVNQSICNGQQFDFYGTAITAAGNYQHTFANSAGCDSVVNLTLQVMDNSNTVIDTAIVQGNSIVLPSGDVVNVPGTYRDTLLSSSGCDSVVTFNVSVISGLPNVDNSNYWHLMPNPAHNQVNLSVTTNFVGSEYQFTNVLGQLMLTGRIQQTYTAISTAALPAGIYLVRVGNFIKRLVKE